MIDIKRELIKSKKTFVNLFYGFMFELSATSSIDMESFTKCLKGLKGIISAQLNNFKGREIQVLLSGELDLIKKIVPLVKDYKKNKKLIVGLVSSFSEKYEREKRLLYS